MSKLRSLCHCGMFTFCTSTSTFHLADLTFRLSILRGLWVSNGCQKCNAYFIVSISHKILTKTIVYFMLPVTARKILCVLWLANVNYVWVGAASSDVKILVKTLNVSALQNLQQAVEETKEPADTQEEGETKKEMSRKVVPIRGDGNCMFRSVSYCIFGTQERHREIRMRVVDRVSDNWHRYKDFIIGDSSYGYCIRSASDYRRLMSRDGEYGGHVELHAASELFPEYTFRVHRNGCCRTIDYGRGRQERHLLFSGYSDAGHYNVLEYY